VVAHYGDCGGRLMSLSKFDVCAEAGEGTGWGHVSHPICSDSTASLIASSYAAWGTDVLGG
jgi:hypothetical protein